MEEEGVVVVVVAVMMGALSQVTGKAGEVVFCYPP